MTLQTQIDGVEKAIVDAKQTIAVSGAPPDAVSLLRSLEATHGRLNQQAEELYTSLNIGGSFPELADLPRPFVHTLLVLNDLKTVIRRRAIASFQEWEALDRAVAGRREPLGELWSLRIFTIANFTRYKAIPGDPQCDLKAPTGSSQVDRQIQRELCETGCPLPGWV